MKFDQSLREWVHFWIHSVFALVVFVGIFYFVTTARSAEANLIHTEFDTEDALENWEQIPASGGWSIEHGVVVSPYSLRAHQLEYAHTHPGPVSYTYRFRIPLGLSRSARSGFLFQEDGDGFAVVFEPERKQWELSSFIDGSMGRSLSTGSAPIVFDQWYTLRFDYTAGSSAVWLIDTTEAYPLYRGAQAIPSPAARFSFFSEQGQSMFDDFAITHIPVIAQQSGATTLSLRASVSDGDEEKRSSITAHPGETIRTDIDVENTGIFPAEQLVVRYTAPDANLSFLSLGGGRMHGSVIEWEIPKLDAGERRMFTARAVVQIDSRSVEAQRGSIEASARNTNTLQQEVLVALERMNSFSEPPDFAADQIRIEQGGDSSYFVFSFKNSGGQAPAGTLAAQVVDVRTGKIYRGSVGGGVFPATYTGEIRMVPALPDVSGTTTYLVRGTIDASRTFEESDETNNTITTHVFVHPASETLPDLVVSAIDAHVFATSFLEVSVRFDNVGTAANPPFDYSISDDQGVFDIHGVSGSDPVPAGGGMTVTHLITLPAHVTELAVRAAIDPSNVIEEKNERNNILTAPYGPSAVSEYKQTLPEALRDTEDTPLLETPQYSADGNSSTLYSHVTDTDGDGLDDHEETLRGTNPFDPDSDDDGFSDGSEVFNGFDPLSTSGVNVSRDGRRYGKSRLPKEVEDAEFAALHKELDMLPLPARAHLTPDMWSFLENAFVYGRYTAGELQYYAEHAPGSAAIHANIPASVWRSSLEYNSLFGSFPVL